MEIIIIAGMVHWGINMCLALIEYLFIHLNSQNHTLRYVFSIWFYGWGHRHPGNVISSVTQLVSQSCSLNPGLVVTFHLSLLLGAQRTSLACDTVFFCSIFGFSHGRKTHAKIFSCLKSWPSISRARGVFGGLWARITFWNLWNSSDSTTFILILTFWFFKSVIQLH